jgi:hypothetical protein
MKPIRLVITKRAADMYCALDGNPKVWSCGQTTAEAIGSWMLTHGSDFDVQIKQLTVEEKHERLVHEWVAVVSAGLQGISVDGQIMRDERLVEHCLRLTPKEFNALRHEVLRGTSMLAVAIANCPDHAPNS